MASLKNLLQGTSACELKGQLKGTRSGLRIIKEMPGWAQSDLPANPLGETSHQCLGALGRDNPRMETPLSPSPWLLGCLSLAVHVSAPFLQTLLGHIALPPIPPPLGSGNRMSSPRIEKSLEITRSQLTRRENKSRDRKTYSEKQEQNWVDSKILQPTV